MSAPTELRLPNAACRTPQAIEAFDRVTVGHRVNTHILDDAKGYCFACPDRKACLLWALHNGEEHGVWGGLSGAELKHLRERKGIVVKRPHNERVRSS